MRLDMFACAQAGLVVTLLASFAEQSVDDVFAQTPIAGVGTSVQGGAMRTEAGVMFFVDAPTVSPEWMSFVNSISAVRLSAVRKPAAPYAPRD
jgi:hypothetical protein